MTSAGLSQEQAKFLEDCLAEFSDRYTDADPEYKNIFESEIPKPPIMYPWQGRQHSYGNRNRDQPNQSRYNQYSQHSQRDGSYNHNRHYEQNPRFQSQQRFRPY